MLVYKNFTFCTTILNYCHLESFNLGPTLEMRKIVKKLEKSTMHDIRCFVFLYAKHAKQDKNYKPNSCHICIIEYCSHEREMMLGVISVKQFETIPVYFSVHPTTTGP